eukprot:11934842-Alexandrium_andersonii.AAC.1
MSASLVGSEMCIRDSSSSALQFPSRPLRSARGGGSVKMCVLIGQNEKCPSAVRSPSRPLRSARGGRTVNKAYLRGLGP